jgi:hypothetical protein
LVNFCISQWLMPSWSHGFGLSCYREASELSGTACNVF